MTATEIIQRKLNELGFKCDVSGVIGTTRNIADSTRQAIVQFKKASGIGSDFYINSDFLKLLDSKYFSKFPSSGYPKSSYKGWNLDLNIKDVKVLIPEIVDNEDTIPATIESDDNVLMYAGVIALLGALYFMMNKKKKRRK